MPAVRAEIPPREYVVDLGCDLAGPRQMRRQIWLLIDDAEPGKIVQLNGDDRLAAAIAEDQLVVG